MTITPVEIRHVKLRRGLGYGRKATDRFLDEVVGSYEEAWRERADLRDEVERLEAELTRFRELERLLRDTMMSAERAAESLRADARREYDLLLQEARLKSRELVDGAEAERERLRRSVRRLEADRDGIAADLRSALAQLEEGAGSRAGLTRGGDLEDTGELALPGQAA